LEHGKVFLEHETEY